MNLINKIKLLRKDQLFLLSFSIVFFLGFFACTNNIGNISQNAIGKEESEVFDEYLKKAKMESSKNNYIEAEKYLNSASEVARKGNWVAGIAISKVELSLIKSQNKDFKSAANLLVEAKDLCNNKSTCSPELLNSTYDNLMFIYIFKTKDNLKIKNTINEIISVRQKLELVENLKGKFNKFIDDMKSVGLHKEAEELSDIVKTL